MKTEAEKDLEAANITITLLLVPGLLWEAFVVCKLWTWFVVPMGVTPLRFFQATGLTMLLGVLIHKTTPKPATPEADAALTWRICGNLFWVPALAIGLGWIAYHLM